jgi:hypothetical protein
MNGHSAWGVPGSSNVHSRSMRFSFANSAGHGCSSKSWLTVISAELAAAVAIPACEHTVLRMGG